jgi:hypothetical protein
MTICLKEELLYAYKGLRSEPIKFMNCTNHRLFKRHAIRHTLQITSPGGVGTTFLYDFANGIGLDIYQPYDGGGCRFDYGVYKHLRLPINKLDHPQINLSPDYRVIYLIGNPYNSVSSIFRRNFQVWAPERLQVPECVKRTFDRNCTLDDYLDKEIDAFHIQEHVMNWTRKPLSKDYPIFVIKYEKISEHQDALLDFMRVPKNLRKYFPKIRPRQSNFSCLSERQIEKLEMIYGELKKYIDSLPDYFIR